MKFYRQLCHLALITLVFSCKPAPEQQEIAEAIPVRQWQPTDTRSIFGNRAPRGLISNSDKGTPGFVLFNPSNSTETYLINKEGLIVHRWKGEFHTILSAYLQDNGHLIRLERDPDFPTFAAGGQGGRIREYDWDGKLLWDYEHADEKELIHHDIEVLPNGNILAISYEVKSAAEAIAAGMDPANVPKAGVWTDKVIEIEPIKPIGGRIVWEWHIWDHLVQEFDRTTSNYGSVRGNPGKMDINAFGEIGLSHMTEEQLGQAKKARFITANATMENHGSDISHTNSVDYHPALDQIVISIKHIGEIVIVDHSTTPEEARGNTGGRQGRGGELLYRWGNPANYGRGSEEDRKLHSQHDAKWIPEGTPGAGNIIVFNNEIIQKGNKFPSIFAAIMAARSPDPEIAIEDIGNYSAVYEITPPLLDMGSYLLEDNAPFGPEEPVWTYTAPDRYSFYSPIMSGAERMKSGNTLITVGVHGRLMEVSPENEVVWEYWNPYNFNYVLPDGTPSQPGNMVFTQYQSALYPPDHPALRERKLEPVSPQPEAFVFKMPPPPAAPSASE